jgi:hypothetical protein
MIESDTVLAVKDEHFVITRNVGFSESHHHSLKGGEAHQVHYPHNGDGVGT